MVWEGTERDMNFNVQDVVLAASIFGGFFFASGRITERVGAKRYVEKQLCGEVHKAITLQLTALSEDIKYIRGRVDNITRRGQNAKEEDHD